MTRLTLTVSKGPQLVAVPDVVGMISDAAKQTLTERGVQRSAYDPRSRDAFTVPSVTRVGRQVRPGVARSTVTADSRTIGDRSRRADR